MEINSILFPAPPPSYTVQTFPEELIWVPSKDHPKIKIPSLLLKSAQGSSKILLYFHGNAEDIGLAYEMTDLLRTSLQIHVLVMEYPGYGMYAGKPRAEEILQDADSVYDFVTSVLGFSSSNIFAFGRSIGSGPATQIARFRGLGCLFLMSPYTSIKDVVQNVAGKLAKKLVADRFRNIDHMPYVTCPTLLIHGVMDTLIPFSHSQELQVLCAGISQIILPKEMDHNYFDYYDDLLVPMANFLDSARITITAENISDGHFQLSQEFYAMPTDQPVAKNSGKVHKLFKRFSQ